MPTYNFRNEETGEEFTEFMFNSEREKYLEENPHIVQIPSTGISIGDPMRLGVMKPDQGFRDVLKNIHKNNNGTGTRYT